MANITICTVQYKFEIFDESKSLLKNSLVLRTDHLPVTLFRSLSNMSTAGVKQDFLHMLALSLTRRISGLTNKRTL